MENKTETIKKKTSTRLTYQQRQREKEDLESFLKIWTWIDSNRTGRENDFVLTGDDWELICAAAGRITRDYENALVRVQAAKEKRQGTGSGAAYSKEKRMRLDAQTKFCRWTEEKKPTDVTLNPTKQVYLLNSREAELVAGIVEIIEDKLEESRRRAAQAAKVRKPIPLAAKARGGRKGSEGKGANGKGRAGRKQVDNPSPATLAKRRQRERDKSLTSESLNGENS